jgi:hypothetical protein
MQGCEHSIMGIIEHQEYQSRYLHRTWGTRGHINGFMKVTVTKKEERNRIPRPKVHLISGVEYLDR